MALGAGPAVAAAGSATIWDGIADEAAAESPVWGEALLPDGERALEPVFSPLAPESYALGLETIYEGYLLHYGRPRLFGPADRDTAVLLGDYLYAHGLVRIADLGDVDVVGDLAELISVCAHLRGAGRGGDGAAWASAAVSLGEWRRSVAPDAAEADWLAHAARRAGRERVDEALDLHAARVA